MKGRLGSDGERFARMTESLLQCSAITTLSHTAFRVLTVLAIGARPPGLNPKRDSGRNGIQAITDTHARKFGFTSRNTVYRSLDVLLERGLIVRTRDGRKNKTHFSLYAVTWLPITHRDGQPLDFPEAALHKYLKWSAPKKPKRRTPNRWQPKLEMPSHGGTQTRPMVGHDRSVCRPIDASDWQISRPMVGNTLRFSEGLPIEEATSNA